jgi:hypothetical protein
MHAPSRQVRRKARDAAANDTIDLRSRRGGIPAAPTGCLTADLDVAELCSLLAPVVIYSYFNGDYIVLVPRLCHP